MRVSACEKNKSEDRGEKETTIERATKKRVLVRVHASERVRMRKRERDEREIDKERKR